MSTLFDLAASYALYRNLSRPGEMRMRRSVALFGSYLVKEPTTTDLLDDTVSRWIRWLFGKSYSQRSVYDYRGDLLTLWRDCAQQGLCEPPKRVSPVKKPEPLPIAWTEDEARLLDAACEHLTGEFPNGVSKSLYCRTLGRTIYDTGLRRSDIFQLDKKQVAADGRVKIRQHKTGMPHDPRMRPATLADFMSLPGDCPLACPFASPSNFYKFWKRVTKAAGVKHGCMQQMRRTGATLLAKDHRDAVQRYLGHRTVEMMKYYIDESIASPQIHLPPPLW